MRRASLRGRLERVSRLTDDELQNAVEFLSIVQPMNHKRVLEACLFEIQSRGGEKWIQPAG